MAALREDESDASPAQQNDRTFPLAFFAGVRGLRGFLLCGAARCGEVSWSGYLVHFLLLSVMMIITIELLDVLSFGSSGTMGVATTKEWVSVGLASQLHCLQMADFETQSK